MSRTSSKFTQKEHKKSLRGVWGQRHAKSSKISKIDFSKNKEKSSKKGENKHKKNN